jgi:hypothetical protein
MRGSFLPIRPDPSKVVVPSSPRPVETGGLLSPIEVSSSLVRY